VCNNADVDVACWTFYGGYMLGLPKEEHECGLFAVSNALVFYRNLAKEVAEISVALPLPLLFHEKNGSAMVASALPFKTNEHQLLSHLTAGTR
jgi:hypothetical protein